ncbi:hypothetical protein [Taibaiella koreensis]|uniref:hypothetical protein n=1 Tax=Taibaiella koreensis TaxID=1268548 RepID=UPI000E59E747|nr:hypothetical protein [Taibaiella koreensis]
MDHKKVQAYLQGIYKQIAANEASMTADDSFTGFLDTSLQELVAEGKALFTTSFTEFGETFTTDYSTTGLLHSAATLKIYQAVLSYRDQKDTAAYQHLLQAYGLILMVETAALKDGDGEESLFSTDIALSLMLALTYFPGDAPGIMRYLLFYLEKNQELMQAKMYANRLGKTDLLPLALFLAEAAGLEDASAIRPYCSDKTDPAYAAAIRDLYTTEENLVNQWVEDLVTSHIDNSKDDWTLSFNNITWQFFPIEIIALLVLRAKKGLDNSFINNPLIAEFLPYIETGVADTALLDHIRERVKA